MRKKNKKMLFFIYQGVDKGTLKKLWDAKSSSKQVLDSAEIFQRVKRPKMYAFNP